MDLSADFKSKPILESLKFDGKKLSWWCCEVVKKLSDIFL